MFTSRPSNMPVGPGYEIGYIVVRAFTIFFFFSFFCTSFLFFMFFFLSFFLFIFIFTCCRCRKTHWIFHGKKGCPGAWFNIRTGSVWFCIPLFRSDQLFRLLFDMNIISLPVSNPALKKNITGNLNKLFTVMFLNLSRYYLERVRCLWLSFFIFLFVCTGQYITLFIIISTSVSAAMH